MSNTNSMNTANTVNAATVAGIYEQIVEIKKKQLELKFTPVQSREKDYTTTVRTLRSNLAKLQRVMVQARAGKSVEMPAIVMAETKKKRGKK